MEKKVGRNDPCPCGSGKKYKQCCYGKETKKTFTADGKRKFSAKVLSTSGKDIFQSVGGGVPPMPTESQPYELLRYKLTQENYQVENIEGPIFKSKETEPTKIVEGKELPLPDEFEMTDIDYRVASKKRDVV